MVEKMDNIKVSVIVPVYNGEKYIQTSISSIINQEFSENYEIIVVDDGSDDNSLDIAQELLSKSDIPYKLVHQRFNVQHIEEIPFETIPIAVEYVHHLVAMFGQADKSQNPNAKTIDAVARHMLWLNHWWSEFGDSIRKLSPTMGHGIHDHFKFGAEDARQIVGREVYMPIFELAQKHNWNSCDFGFKQLQECGVKSCSTKM